MKKLSKYQSDRPVEGDVATLLRALQAHPYSTKEELGSKLKKHIEGIEDFSSLWEYVEEQGWISLSSPGLSLSDEGEAWLNEHGSELTIEEEDLGTEDRPNKPYAVAKLKLETRNLSVFQALRKIEKNEIDLNPEFQRAFVWDEIKQSRLIESILIRIPLPAFYLDATDQTNWSVVDGLQRLTTLYRYCRNESFPLKGLQFLSELEGFRFEALPSKYQVLIEDDTQLLFYNLMPGTPIEAKFTIFSRVNTGGMQLTPQEIRHALNQGPITALLAKLAKDTAFRNATQGVVESLRMSDRELILRSLAFMHLGTDEYRHYNEMDAFLLHSMSDMNKQPPNVLRKLATEFKESVEKVYSIFGRYSFRKFTERGGRRSPFNKALFEVWTCSVRNYSSDALLQNREAIIFGFIELINHSQSFVRSITSSTASHKAVYTRFSKIEHLLSKVIS